MLESRPMEAIRELLEWVAQESGVFVASIFPLLLIGIAGLYLLWLVLGYLRVSQVGLVDSGHGTPTRAALPASDPDGRPRGVAYCPVDGLQYPAGATFCAACESDLLLDCTNCGTTLRSGDARCFRCGTPIGTSDVQLLS